MKVLSLKEPYATLIKEKKKLIETRSWATKYRGELYIHASTTTNIKQWEHRKDLIELLNNTPLNFGNIICKCKLIDCIYMTEDYIENLKRNNYQEYICGQYEKGRYAWILTDIVPLKETIKAKGQLNIWNYYNELEVMQLMNNINYGWIDKNYKQHLVVDESIIGNYILQTPREVIKNKIGLCWDQVELERYYFKNNLWNIKTYFIVYKDEYKNVTHSFLTFTKNDKYYWFEHAWEKYKGIYEYDALENLLLDVKNKFVQSELMASFNKKYLKIYEYNKPSFHITDQEFYHHCENGKKIKLV